MQLTSALAIPPHARVNSQCYPIWNTDRNDLQLVWRGATYAHGFHAFNEQPSERKGCISSGCVQRLWCTDSGTAGWYGGETGIDVQLTAAWLGHSDTTYSCVLSAVGDSKRGRKSVAHVMKRTSPNGPGTVVVAGNTLYFYTYDGGERVVDALPRLSSLVFSEWRSGVSGSDLVSEGLHAHNVLGYRGAFTWVGIASPLYPSGPGAVTLSVEDWPCANDWAIDAVVESGATGALVHYLRTDNPGIYSANREVATFPHYTCRASLDGNVRCASVISSGYYTWSSTAEAALGQRFTPLGGVFALPGNLWLLVGAGPTMEYSDVYVALVGFGHAPALGVTGDTLVAIETRPDASCASGNRLHLVTRALPDAAERATEPLNCEWRQVAPAAYWFEPAYGALAVKWAGPWAESPLFTAVSLEKSVYHSRGKPETQWSGDAGTNHAVWASGWRSRERRCVVTLHSASGLRRCSAPGKSRIPDTMQFAVAAARGGDAACLAALVPEHIAPNTWLSGCPLLAHARGAAVGALLAAGADANMKCANMSTPLMYVMAELPPVTALLEAGAAVCTWPLSATRPPMGFIINHLNIVCDAASSAPCEPGFWLGAGRQCDGMTACGPGSFCPGYKARTNEARPCPRGTYGPLEGAVSVVQCRLCPPERPYSAPGSVDSNECVTDLPAGSARPLVQSRRRRITKS